jgi:hypothetical protein
LAYEGGFSNPSPWLVAKLVCLIDGDTSVGALVGKLDDGREASERALIERNVLPALQILYVDGTIADLRGW